MRAFGGGFIAPLASETALVPGYVPVSSLEALLGPDAGFAQNGYLRFAVDFRYQQGEFDAVRATFTVSGPNAEDEQRTSVSGE